MGLTVSRKTRKIFSRRAEKLESFNGLSYKNIYRKKISYERSLIKTPILCLV